MANIETGGWEGGVALTASFLVYAVFLCLFPVMPPDSHALKMQTFSVSPSSHPLLLMESYLLCLSLTDWYCFSFFFKKQL